MQRSSTTARKPSTTTTSSSTSVRRSSTSSTSSVKTTPTKSDTTTTAGKTSTGKWHGEDRLSKKFDKLRTNDPFAKKEKNSTNFAFVYSQGGIPCRINHGGVFSRLQWDVDVVTTPYDPLLINFSEGIRETVHPYVFVAQTGFKELLEAEGAKEKTVPLLPHIVRNLRAAMMGADEATFMAALNAIQQVSNCVGEEFNPHMGVLLIQVNKKAFERKFREVIFETLVTLDQNGGPAATKIIKGKVPAFSYQ